MSDFGNITAETSSLFAAVAALASWASVMRSQQDARERHLPNLQISVVQIEAGQGAGRPDTTVVILNAGAGVAKGAVCVVKLGDDYFANPVGPGFMRYEQEARFTAKMRKTQDRQALVVCRDLDERVWAWDLSGRRKRYGGKAVDPQRDSQQLWSDFYGEELKGNSVAAQLNV